MLLPLAMVTPWPAASTTQPNQTLLPSSMRIVPVPVTVAAT